MREHHYASFFFVQENLVLPLSLAPNCQKNGHFSLEKAFSAFFLAMVLAVTSAIIVARAYRAAKEDPVGALSKE